MSDGPFGLGTVVLALLVLALGLGIGAGIHFVVLALSNDWVIHALIWPLLLFGVFKLWRAARQYRGYDAEAASRQLSEEFARAEMKRATERRLAKEKAEAASPSEESAAPPQSLNSDEETTSPEEPESPPAAPK
ncbi:MAG: hypothetical protein V3W41_01050 [Planctomycetota bacterium]